jgi:hypothetical protein
MILLLDLCTNSGHNLWFFFVLTVIYFYVFLCYKYVQAGQSKAHLTSHADFK